MARKKKTDEPVSDARIADYRYDDSKRKNIPPAGLAAQGKVAESNRIEYAYNPHLPPVLRSDPAGKYKRVAVKVIDPRGNEVLKIHGLGIKEASYDLH